MRVSAPWCFVELGHAVEFLVRNRSFTTQIQISMMQTIAVLRRTHLNIEDRAQTMLNLEQKHVFATCGTLNFENRLIFGEVIPYLSFSVHFFVGAKMARILPTAK